MTKENVERGPKEKEPEATQEEGRGGKREGEQSIPLDHSIECIPYPTEQDKSRIVRDALKVIESNKKKLNKEDDEFTSINSLHPHV